MEGSGRELGREWFDVDMCRVGFAGVRGFGGLWGLRRDVSRLPDAFGFGGETTGAGWSENRRTSELAEDSN